jgi:mitochondrial fission protein ELM1
VPEAALRVWALLGARPGDNDQVLALAEALALPFETQQLSYNPLNRLGPGLLGRSLASLTRSSRAALLGKPPPDLTISTGHRSVPVVRALRRRSAGRMRTIHIGFPRLSPSHFDLVVATPQYPIADHPNLLRIPYALTVNRSASHDDRLARLPCPRRLLIVGGPTLYWELDEAAVLGTLANMIAEANEGRGSVLVTTSARTPVALRREIEAALATHEAPALLAEPGAPPAYRDLLAAADEIHVTADSVSMISDAMWVRMPLTIIPIRKSAFGTVVFAAMDRLRPATHVYPQDLRFFWQALEDVGVSGRLAVPQTSTEEVLRRVLERCHAVIDRCRPGEGEART